MRKSMAGKNRIETIMGIEYDMKTGKPVFRTSSGRPYILEEYEHNPINRDELGLIYLAFYRRVVQDASGPDFYDNTVTDKIRDDSRSFLLNGVLYENGYYVYEHSPEENKKRVYEKRFLRFVQCDEIQESRIKLADIANYAGIDYNDIHKKIIDWYLSNWKTNHPFFKDVMESTKYLEG